VAARAARRAAAGAHGHLEIATHARDYNPPLREAIAPVAPGRGVKAA